MVTKLARESGLSVVVPFYHFVPGSSSTEIQAQILAVYNTIVATADPSKVSVAGDSAGGNLALTLLQLVERDKQPGCVVAVSPVVDLRASNPLIDALERKDPLLPLGAILHLLPSFYRDSNAVDPFVSLLFADYSKVRSKLYILNGAKDLLSPDIELFHKKLFCQEISHCYVFEKYLPHAWPILPLFSSRQTRKQIVGWCSQAA